MGPISMLCPWRTHAWHNRFHKLLVSFEKTEVSYIALLSLACAMIR